MSILAMTGCRATTIEALSTITHPDDELFCVGDTLASYVAVGAATDEAFHLAGNPAYQLEDGLTPHSPSELRQLNI